MQLGTPSGGMSFDTNGAPKVLDKAMDNYIQSKIGGSWLAAEFSKRLGSKGILSVVSTRGASNTRQDALIIEQSLHPGLMRTELQRNQPWLVRTLMV
jgi:retinol dehydrogenase-12